MGFFKIPPSIAAMNVKPKVTGCSVCKLDQSGKDAVFAGNGKDKVLILCDHPRGKEGNDSETVFLHKMYDYLWDLQGKRGLPDDFLDAAWVGYVLPCPCPKDAEPKPDCCKARLASFCSSSVNSARIKSVAISSGAPFSFKKSRIS